MTRDKSPTPIRWVADTVSQRGYCYTADGVRRPLSQQSSNILSLDLSCLSRRTDKDKKRDVEPSKRLVRCRVFAIEIGSLIFVVSLSLSPLKYVSFIVPLYTLDPHRDRRLLTSHTRKEQNAAVSFAATMAPTKRSINMVTKAIHDDVPAGTLFSFKRVSGATWF